MYNTVKFFDRAKNAYRYIIWSKVEVNNVRRCWLRLVLFSIENHIFIEKDNLSEEVLMVEEELDGIENLDLPTLVFIEEVYGNLKIVVVDGGEFTRNINKKKKPEVL